MAGLQADELNSEFFRSFMPETIYLVEGDAPVPVVQPEQHTPVQAAEVGIPARETAPDAPAIAHEAVEQVPKAIPAIPKMPPAQPATRKFEVLGEHKRGVVVLVTLPAQEFGKLPQLEFLQKILRAIGLQAADVAYVNNISGETARFEELRQELPVNYIISFASRLDTEFPHEKFTLYNPVQVDGVPVVFSQALAMLENDVEHKKMLWNALRQVFL